MRVIYLDSFLIASLLLHYLCLLLLDGITQKSKRRKYRLFFAAFSGALLDLLGIVFPFPQEVLIKVFYSFFEIFLAAFIAFGCKKIIRNAILLFFLTSAIAGCLFSFSSETMAVICFFAIVISFTARYLLQKVLFSNQTKVYECIVFLRFFDEEKKLNGFIDSGNRLSMPGSSLPVFVGDQVLFSDWLRRAQQEVPEKLVTLPFHGVGGKGLINGFRLSAKLPEEKEFREVALVLAEHSLFSGKEYHLLMQPLQKYG